MSIRKRVAVSLITSLSISLLLSLSLIYYLSSKLLTSRVMEVYNLTYENYKKLLKWEEEDLRFLSEDGLEYGGHYCVFPEEQKACEGSPHYRIYEGGVCYGIYRQLKKGCYFVGVSLEEALKFIADLMGAEYLIYYERKYVGELVKDFDSFIKGKIVMEDMVIDRFSSQELLKLPLRIEGYTVYGNLFNKRLLMEVPITNNKGLIFGRALLVKDISYLYEETFKVFLALSLYSLLVFTLLGYVLFRISSGLAKRIILLKDITTGIEGRDFSRVSLLENSDKNLKDELDELKHSIYNMAISLKSAFEELEEKNKELEELAYYDTLTGLPNRRFFYEHANLLFENAKRYKTPISLLVMDIDHFKKINDTYGHDAGDLVLKNFADIVRKNIRQSDLPARFGGEEFVLLLPNTTLSQAKAVAERIRKAFENSVVIYRGQEVRTTLSGGLAEFREGMENIDELIRLADMALYRAKELDRNRIEAYEPNKD